MTASHTLKIAYQGAAGAYHETAAAALFPQATLLPCPTFQQAFAALTAGTADRAVLAVENIIAGRVADVHALLPIILPQSSLHIVGEYFLPISHHLLAAPTASLASIKTVLSQEVALHQCRKFLAEHHLTSAVYHDTAAAAAEVARLWQESGDNSIAAIASARAGTLYGLQSLATNIADNPHNTTRFLVLAAEPMRPPVTVPSITTLVFTLRNIPAALYKALGGFATNGINLTKIESYLAADDFISAQFYVDAAAHIDAPAMQNALDELRFFCTSLHILGVYPAARPEAAAPAS